MTTLESPQNGQLPDAAPPKLSPRVESPIERIERVKKYLHDKTLIANEDYGTIPGSRNGAKPTLLKPGAQKLCGLFSLAPTVKNVDRVFKPELIAYEVTFQVVNKATGVVEGEGLGACNSKERKYKNQDGYDIANTLLKMAGKRALVDATLNALGISSLFTQDIEDFAPDAPAAAPPEPERVGNIAALSNSDLRAWCDFVANECPNHPQKAAFKAEYQKRREANAKAKSEVARAEMPDASQPVDRWSAINAAAQGTKPGEGKAYLDFIAALSKRGIPWASDADVVAFETAASAKLAYAVVCEDLAPNDWEAFAVMLVNDELRFGA